MFLIHSGRWYGLQGYAYEKEEACKKSCCGKHDLIFKQKKIKIKS